MMYKSSHLNASYYYNQFHISCLRWSGAFIQWGQQCRLRHVTSGRYLAVTHDKQVATVHRNKAAERAVTFYLLQTKVKNQLLSLEIHITLSCVSLDDIFKYHLMMLIVSTVFFHQQLFYNSGREEAVRNIRRWGDGEVWHQVWWHNCVHSALWHRTVAVVPDNRGQEEGRGQSGGEEGRWTSFLEFRSMQRVLSSRLFGTNCFLKYAWRVI